MAIARCLSEPEFDLEQHLSVFVRDEMIYWFTQSRSHAMNQDAQLREKVQYSCDVMVRKAAGLAVAGQGGVPANMAVIELLGKASNPVNLCAADYLWMPYL